MENITPKQSSINITVSTLARGIGRARQTKEIATRLQQDMLALLVMHRHGKNHAIVTMLNSLMNLTLSLQMMFQQSTLVRTQKR